MSHSILQTWVTELGLRHQGVLLTVIRGCDDAPKHDPSKLFTRCVRDMILRPFCGDPSKAQTFIEHVGADELARRFDAFRKNLDHYPHHYVMHVIHAIEIIGYHYPGPVVADPWLSMYQRLCHGLHVNPETKEQLDDRLNADEETFGRRDRS